MNLASCVVVAFHDPESLGRLLPRLAHPEVEIVVVNVEEDPEVASVARRLGASLVTLADNPGYASAVNQGAKACSSSVLVFMNDDVVADAGAVLALANVIIRDVADVAVPAVIRPDGERDFTIASIPTPASLALEWMLLPDSPIRWLARVVSVEKWRAPDAAQVIQAAAGIVVATTARLLDEEPLPEAYFLYWEESEWFWHLRSRGRIVHYRPEAVVCHAGGRDDVRPEKSRLLSRNAIRCVRRTQGRLAAVVTVPIVVLWNIRLAATAAVRALIRPRARERAMLRARLAGLHASLIAWDEAVREA